MPAKCHTAMIFLRRGQNPDWNAGLFLILHFETRTVTVSLSIFDKICPSCAARISVSAERCVCGHHFDSSEPSEQEAALRDEEIYEGYLAARAAQAHEAAHVARQALFDDPGNAELQSAMDLASEVAKSLDADLTEQRAKIAQLRSKLPAKKQESAPQAETTSKSTPQASKAAAPKTPASRQSARTPAAAAKPQKKAPQPRMETPVVEQLSVPVVSPVAVVSPVPVTAAASVTPAVVAPPAAHLPGTANAASVLETIRNANARERAMRNSQADEVENPIATPAAFRAEQAERAEKAMSAVLHHTGKDCPNCTSNVPVNTTRCRCGFQFESGSSEMPSLTLCTGDFSALRDSLNLNLRRS